MAIDFVVHRLKKLSFQSVLEFYASAENIEIQNICFKICFQEIKLTSVGYTV